MRDLDAREAEVVACRARITALEKEYHEACAACDWSQADRVRVILIEAVEAGLDATAGFFKALELPRAKKG